MMQKTIAKLVQRQDLTATEAYAVLSEIMSGKATPVQIAAFLTALATKSGKTPTAEEIAGCANAMREKALPFSTHGKQTIELVGTGGDGSNSINISTMAAIVTAAAGVPVTKHGNVAASSQCGTANVMEELGVHTHLTPAQMEQVLEEANICFLHAQVYHTAMKYVGSIRKELGFRTIFNILGPLTNPAKPTYQLLGVYDEALLEPMAKALQELGVQRGAVVYGTDGMDELSISAPSLVCEFTQMGERTYTLTPQELGLPLGTKEEIRGGDPAYNAQIVEKVFRGTIRDAKRNVVLLNSGMALYLAGKVDTIQQGIALAADCIDNGKALHTLHVLMQATQAQEVLS